MSCHQEYNQRVPLSVLERQSLFGFALGSPIKKNKMKRVNVLKGRTSSCLLILTEDVKDLGGYKCLAATQNQPLINTRVSSSLQPTAMESATIDAWYMDDDTVTDQRAPHRCVIGLNSV